MNKWFEILVGLIFVIGAILIGYYFQSWYYSAVAVFKGGILWFLVGIGLILILLGISELKE